MHWLKAKGFHTARRQKRLDKYSLFIIKGKGMIRRQRHTRKKRICKVKMKPRYKFWKRRDELL